MSEPEQPNLHQAAAELQRYLSDEIAPMMAVEYLEELVPLPPEVTAKIIAQWIQSQARRPSEGVTTSDLIYHALKKLSVLSELELVNRSTVMRSIHEVSRVLVSVCPEAERTDLRIRLSQLGQSSTVLATRAEFLHRASGSEGVAASAPRGAATPVGTAPIGTPPMPTAASVKAADARPDPETMSRGARALSLLLGGLAKLRNPKEPPKKEGPEAEMLAQILSTAALESKTNEDLARHLDRVKQDGVATPMGQVFRALGWSLPGWGTIAEEGKPLDTKAGRKLQAMDRIVALAPNAQERAKRWGEMIYAAIEQLNEGRLAQAVSILEVAKSLIAERRPDAEIVAQVLQQAEAAISEDLLRRLADQPTKHGLLRKVLDFFPSLRPDMLLSHLDGELRREKRKLILTLLECHGPPSRSSVLARLSSTMQGEVPDAEGFYRRNLAFLLRRIPRAGSERIEEEITLLAAMMEPTEPPISAKEAVGALGQIRQRPAEIALVDRLRHLEAEMVSRGGTADRWEMADRLCAALARQGTSRAIRAIAAHAYNRAPALGDALARFEHLSRIDLTVDPEQLAVLTKAIRELAPSKMLGFSVAKGSQHELSCLMQAVAGTPTQEVRAALELILGKSQRTALGEQAQRILSKLEPVAKKSTEALTGDLELFGLPGLLQTLSGSESSGELVLFDVHQARQGSITLVKGKVGRCEAGKLTGEEAVYLMMERPFPGTFAFRAASDQTRTLKGPTLDPMMLILEGARRHDEYLQAKAFAQDGVRYEATGSAVVRPEEETDGDFASDVWTRAAAGTPANDCELEMKTDPFRVRRLYAAWVQAQALRPRAA